MSKAPFLKLYTADYRDGVRTLTFEEQGFYAYVLTLMWDAKGRLPADPKKLAVMMQADPRQVTRLTAALIVKAKLKTDGDWLVNPRIERELEKAASEDRPKMSETSAEDQPKIAEKKSEKPIKSMGEKSLLPDTRYQIPEERGCERARATGGEEIAPGVFVDAAAIRHRSFTISLPAIELGTIASGLPRAEVRNRCLVYAMQWAAEIDAGKLSRDVVPGHIANFLQASIMGEKNRADSRRPTATRQHAKPGVFELLQQGAVQ